MLSQVNTSNISAVFAVVVVGWLGSGTGGGVRCLAGISAKSS